MELTVRSNQIQFESDVSKSDFNKLTPSITERIKFASLVLVDILMYFLAKRYRTFLSGIYLLPPKFMDWASRTYARRAYYSAAQKVPAYKDFINDKVIKKWNDVPFTDKDAYVKKYTTEQRCVNGKIPFTTTAIDESSGSTGTPYNWVRSLRERHESHTFVSYFSSYCYGEKPWITINAFSMGAWATGINMGIALQRNGIVKNTGPDICKILHTLEFFGTGYDYVITGYPPFIKQLYDHAKETNFPWEKYHLSALVGGEGMSEGLRDYLLPGFKKIFSGYGATDLEIGIGGETPLSISIRRLAKENPTVRKALFGDDSRLPMIFQYNPLMHYIEKNSNNELIFTINRKSLLSPRIRYNIHDEGGIIRYDQLHDKLKSLGYELDDLTKQGKNKNLVLPFVWIYGRRDFTISIMGANIYPEDIEQCLYEDKELAKITRSFCQRISEGENASVRPAFYFEITQKPTEVLKNKFSKSIIVNLIKINADFREAWHEYSGTLQPEIYLFGIGEGPFKTDPNKIKQTRLINNYSGKGC